MAIYENNDGYLMIIPHTDSTKEMKLMAISQKHTTISGRAFSPQEKEHIMRLNKMPINLISRKNACHVRICNSKHRKDKATLHEMAFKK